MGRKSVRILWAVVLLLMASCSAKKEVLGPPPPPPASPPAPAPAPAPAAPRVEVIQLQMTVDRDFVGVKIRVAGDRIDLDAQDIYMIDEATGEKFTVVRLQRIGRLAEFSVPGESGIHHIMFRNRDGRLKVGKRVTLVVGKSRHEHLLIRR
jgi:hypothetical protein